MAVSIPLNTFSYSDLCEAWDQNNTQKFQNCLTDDVNARIIEEIFTKIVKDRQKILLGLHFAKILFENHRHRKIFPTGKSLIFRLVEVGHWQMLKLLLEYYPNLRQVDTDGNTALHFLCQKKWDDENSHLLSACMDLLLNHKEIDINALNNDEKTPIDLALQHKNEQAIKMLLECGKRLYLDGVIRGRNTSRTNLMKKYLQFSDLIMKHKKDDGRKITVSKLLFLLRRGRADEFLLSFPNAFNDESLINSTSNKKNILLQEACKRQELLIIQQLLDYGADASYIDEWNDFRSAITVTIEESTNFQILTILLKTTTGIKMKLENSKSYFEKINQKDGDGNTVLHYAANEGNPAAILEILECGGYLGSENSNHETPLSKIPASILKSFLDKNIKLSKSKSNCWDVTFNYKFLAQRDSANGKKPLEIKILNQMTTIKSLKPLLTHPVLASFIHLKWEKSQRFYFLNFIFYSLLCIFLTFNILWLSVTNQNIPIFTRIVQGILVTGLFIRENFQACNRCKNYVQNYDNLIELVLVLGGGFLTISYDNKWCRHVGGIVLTLSWAGFLLLIGKLPQFSVQIQMFLIVLKRFIKILSVYLIMILAFALSFYVLLSQCESCEDKPFANVGLSIFKTLIMVSGEFDAKSPMFAIYPYSSHFLFILFIFLIVIVLMNLLNGMAVYDTNKIKKQSKLHICISRIKYLNSLEETVLHLSERFDKNSKNWFVQNLKSFLDTYYWNFEETFTSGGTNIMNKKIIEEAYSILKERFCKRNDFVLDSVEPLSIDDDTSSTHSSVLYDTQNLFSDEPVEENVEVKPIKLDKRLIWTYPRNEIEKIDAKSFIKLLTEGIKEFNERLTAAEKMSFCFGTEPRKDDAVHKCSKCFKDIPIINEELEKIRYDLDKMVVIWYKESRKRRECCEHVTRDSPYFFGKHVVFNTIQKNYDKFCEVEKKMRQHCDIEHDLDKKRRILDEIEMDHLLTEIGHGNVSIQFI